MFSYALAKEVKQHEKFVKTNYYLEQKQQQNKQPAEPGPLPVARPAFSSSSSSMNWTRIYILIFPIYDFSLPCRLLLLHTGCPTWIGTPCRYIPMSLIFVGHKHVLTQTNNSILADQQQSYMMTRYIKKSVCFLSF